MPRKDERNSWIWKIPHEQFSVAVRKADNMSGLILAIGGRGTGISRTMKARLEAEKIDWDHIKPKIQTGKNWRNLPRPEQKACNKCGACLPFNNEFFPIHKRCPWGLNPYCRKCYNAAALPNNKRAMKKIRLAVLSAYGKDGKPICQCCGETYFEFLALDHINGGGSKERKHYPAHQLHRHLMRTGFPPGYRTLCHNCNVSLGLYGYCPHSKGVAAHAV